MQKFIGTGIALITPFKEDLSVDFTALIQLVNYNIENGTDYLVISGTTGESVTITKQEKKDIIKTISTANKGRLPLVLGIGGNNTAAVIEEIKTEVTDGYYHSAGLKYYNSKFDKKTTWSDVYSLTRYHYDEIFYSDLKSKVNPFLYDGYIILKSEKIGGDQSSDLTLVASEQISNRLPGFYWQHISYVVVWWFMGLLLLIAPAFPQFRAKGDKVNSKVSKAKKVGLKK